MSTPGKRFRVAFSFAGEKRDFVEKVARILADCFGEAAILYDRFHEAEFAIYDLGIRLPRLYGGQSDLIVPILCPTYDVKRWTGWEWIHIYGLLTKADGHRVMPCRFEKATADGLSPAAGFIELDDKTPAQAATLILERLALNEGKPKEHFLSLRHSSFVIPSTSTPNNLPRLQPFFGRAAELATIREALDPESRTWGALIDGPGGMGKTSLAVRAAYDCPPGLFQRIVFVSVKDREMDDDGERPLGNLLVPGFLETLNELARELGQPDIAKSPEDQRIRLLLDALRPSQALLILDNLESLPKTERSQVFTFVKRLPPGCKAILTSRRRIGSGSEELILEKLDQDAALATLADLARRNPLLARTSEAERIALYTQTAGKPLLLRWVAGQLGRGSCRTFPDALAFLRTCPPDNDPLEFIFGDLAKEFTADEEKVLCALTYFSLPAKVGHIAEIAGLNVESAEIALRTLANRSLVVPDQEEKHYILVPMVSEFLRKHRAEVIESTGERLEKRACELIDENGWGKHDHFPVLETAWPVVAPAIPLFLKGSNGLLQCICNGLTDFLNFSGRWDEWLSLNQQAERRAIDSGDDLEAGWRAYQAGFVHNSREEKIAVLECADRIDGYWNGTEVRVHERALALAMRGNAHQQLGDFDRAITAYRDGVDLLKSSSADPVEIASALNSLAGALLESGNLISAQKCFREALKAARSGDDGALVAMYIGNLAAVALRRDHSRRAEILARDALKRMEQIGLESSIAADCHRLANALNLQGKFADARPYALRAVEIYTRLRLPILKSVRETLMRCDEGLLTPTHSQKAVATLGAALRSFFRFLLLILISHAA